MDESSDGTSISGAGNSGNTGPAYEREELVVREDTGQFYINDERVIPIYDDWVLFCMHHKEHGNMDLVLSEEAGSDSDGPDTPAVDSPIGRKRRLAEVASPVDDVSTL